MTRSLPKHVTAFGVALAIIATLAILAYTNLEIYDDVRYREPSREASANSYLALERWLANAGQTARVTGFDDANHLIHAPEHTVLLEASRFDWDEATWETLQPWLADGAHLIIALDAYQYDDVVTLFLTNLGVRPRLRKDPADALSDEEVRYRSVDIIPPESSAPLPNFDNTVGFTAFFNQAEPDHEPRFPDSARALRDADGVIRLVTLPIGNGLVTVTGRTRFMYNWNIAKKQNARLTWELMGAAGGDVLFVRTLVADAPRFWGRVAEHGNLLPLAVSLLLLLAVAFWMLIPVFGVVREDAPKPGKSIRERFLAEGRFLHKHDALDTYREVYIREIRGTHSDAAIPPKEKNFMKELLVLQELMEQKND
jgi:hypothetical protein